MLNIDDVKATFGDVIYLTTVTFIPAEDFTNLFSDAQTLSYTDLCNAVAAEGYISFFDKCKAEGILV